MIASPARIRVLARWGAFAVALAVFARLLLGAEGAGAFSLVGARGAILTLGFLPFLAAALLDAVAWKRVIRALGHAPGLLTLVRVRLSAEALNLTLPAGAAVAEAITPSLLHRACGIPFGDGVVALAARRWTVVRAHALYLMLAGAVALARPAARRPFVPWLLFLFAATALAAAVFVRLLFEEKGGSTLVEAALEKLPGRLHAYFVQRRAAFAAVNLRFQAFAAVEKVEWPATTALYLGAWLVEALETFILLRLLGAPLSFLDVLPVEAALSFVRSAAFIAPAGLGVQDLGYMTLFDALPRTLLLAFVALKRGKELCWAGAGYLTLLVAGKAPAPVVEASA